jgi:predicted DsbA family dithiol-disulfide isomerase
MPAMQSSSSIPMPIDVVSDIVCPWCFIGKRRLEKALALRPEIAAEVRWRPYFLNDWIPREGIDRKTYLETKFGSVERYAAIAERVAAAARSEGLDYALDKIARQPNTLDCHRLILWARSTSDPGRMKQRLMELYFSEGADLTDPEVLVGAAVDCGMDADLVRKLLAGDADVERVETEARSAKEAGVDGVPCFVFGNVLAVSGAQDPAYLADAMGRAAAEYAARRAAGRSTARMSSASKS